VLKKFLIGAWRSLEARLLWEQEVGGSNPLAPTIKKIKSISYETSISSKIGFFAFCLPNIYHTR
jgi:hypothetical protein